MGDIVAKFPQAGDTFKRYHIDFCCGGDHLLGDAVAEHAVDGATLLKELNEAYNEAIRQGVEMVDLASSSAK